MACCPGANRSEREQTFLKKTVAVVMAILLMFPIIMIVSSESGEVVVIRSESSGNTLETRIWVVDLPEGLLVRGTESKAWIVAARQAADVEIERDDIKRRYHVVEQPGNEARHRANDLMREKYGLGDLMISLFRDSDTTVPLLLTEIPPPTAATLPDTAEPAEAPSISASELNESRESGSGPVVIDVRTPEEYASGHMPGAINIPFDQVASRISEVDAPNGVALYCMIGPRARKGEAALLASGYGEVFHLEGGLAAWKEAGLPVTPAQ